MIDTHAHIYLLDFKDDIHDVIRASKEAGVEKIYMPNIDSSSIDSMLQLEQHFGNYCSPMMGLHPCYVKDNYRHELRIVESWLTKHNFFAIGEIGIDLYWDKTHINEQIIAFETQISWAKDLGLPVVIHCRESLDQTIDLVAKHQDGSLKGIFHCFSGDANQAKKIIDLNFLMGIGGIVTFKNGGLDKIMPGINVNNIVLETDSPYLAPTPYRGKRNTPAYLQHIAKRIAELKNCDVLEIEQKTTENAKNVFKK